MSNSKLRDVRINDKLYSEQGDEYKILDIRVTTSIGVRLPQVHIKYRYVLMNNKTGVNESEWNDFWNLINDSK